MFFFIKQKIDFFDCIRITLFLIGRAGGKKEWAVRKINDREKKDEFHEPRCLFRNFITNLI